MPFYLQAIFGLDLRVLRLLRFLKLSRYSPALYTLVRVVFEAGDFFGATSMLLSDAPSAPFVTATKCRLLKLHAEDFHRLESINPNLCSEIRRRAVDPSTVSR